MRTTVLFALAGIVAVIAVAGFALASGQAASSLGERAQPGNGQGMMGDGSCGSGQMHQWTREYCQEYGNITKDCPMQYDHNYSWSYDYNSCPKMS